VIDGDGEPLGFVIRAATQRKPRTRRSFWTAEQIGAKVDAESGLQIELKLRDKETQPTGLRIITPLANFEHQVRVETSADGAAWTAAGAPAVIFDYSKYVDARSDLVPFEAGESRRFRVTIADLTAEQELQLLELHRRLRGDEVVERDEKTFIDQRAFRVERIEFYRDESEVAKGETLMTAYPTEDMQLEQAPKEKQTHVLISTRYEPVTEMKLVTGEENFSRAVAVQAEVEDSQGRSDWRTIATGTLVRYSVGAIRRDEAKIDLPATYANRYRLVIENRDSPPLEITGVELQGPVMEIVFLAEPNKTRRLEYGNPEISAGQYDTGALTAALAINPATIAAELQAPRENTSAPVGRMWKPWEDRRVLAGTGLALALLLGWGLVQASRRVLPPVE
jgi:hypothetical protein